MNDNNQKEYNRRIVIVTDGGLDDAIAIQYLLTHPKITTFLNDENNCMDIRCVSGCVTAVQTLYNTARVIKSASAYKYSNIYVTNVPAPYDNEIEPWDGYGADGVLGLFDDIDIPLFPFVNPGKSVTGEHIAVLSLAPFTHSNEFLKGHIKRTEYVVAMGGSSSENEADEMEFNQSLDQNAFKQFNTLCKENEISYKLVTMEECRENDRVLIDVNDDIREFYNRFEVYCDAYTKQMIDLGLNTTCYDLIAAIQFVKDFK